MKKVAIIGLGEVGSSVYQKLTDQSMDGFQITRVVVKNAEKRREIGGFELLLSSLEEVLADDNIDIVIELINDEHAALEIAEKALKKGKILISANKKMLAKHLSSLQDIAIQNGTEIFYEAAVCGSIPIILLLKQYYAGNRPQKIRTIANGTSNFILSKLWASSHSFLEIIEAAQQAGFAETDPTDDVAGYDVRSKLSLLISNAFNTRISTDIIPCFGIQHIKRCSIDFLKEKGLKVKLIGEASLTNNHLLCSVCPCVMASDDTFYNVEEEQNIVEIENQLSDLQLYQGKGAGGYPTTQAVLADLQASNSMRLNSLKSTEEVQYHEFTVHLFYIDKHPSNVEGIEVIFALRGHYVVKASYEALKQLANKLEGLFVAKISPRDFKLYFV